MPRLFTIPRTTVRHPLGDKIDQGGTADRVIIKNDLAATHLSESARGKFLDILATFYTENLGVVTTVQDHHRVDLSPYTPKGHLIVSLDAQILCDVYLPVSRVFARADQFLAGNDQRKPVATNIGVIDTHAVYDRDVALVDDDTMSGWNLERARVHLEGLGARVHPVAALALDTGPNVDVIDASDFLVKGDYGLMTVSLDGHIRRIPYTMPGVNPVQRAGVPQSALLEFAQMAQRLRSIEMSALAPKSC